MESALEVDLTEQETTAQQALGSALRQNSSISSSQHPLDPANVQTIEQPQRSSKGGSATTIQPKLNPRAAPQRHSRSPSPSHKARPEESVELGGHDDSTNTYRLQPVDEGFGAWSYVASAFAMYVVVWGMI